MIPAHPECGLPVIFAPGGPKAVIWALESVKLQVASSPDVNPLAVITNISPLVTTCVAVKEP